MVIFSIVLMTTMFTCFNLKKYDFDYMSPVNIFCIVFLLSELICCQMLQISQSNFIGLRFLCCCFQWLYLLYFHVIFIKIKKRV